MSPSFQYYQFTEFAMSLNEVERDMKGQLCPTDSRLRPDVRLLEQGDIDAAAAEKTRLEDKQRTARKALKKSPDGWQPRWVLLVTNSLLLILTQQGATNTGHMYTITRSIKLPRNQICFSAFWVNS